jgi:hypothetical protein
MKVMVGVGILQLLAIALTFKSGIFPMVIAYTSVFFIGLLVWHYYTNKLIQLHLLSVVKDISPYLLTSLGAICITWLLTKGISNLYLLLFAKIIIVTILYICAMKLFNSKIFMESYNFIKSKKG